MDEDWFFAGGCYTSRFVKPDKKYEIDKNYIKALLICDAMIQRESGDSNYKDFKRVVLWTRPKEAGLVQKL